jgi:hypothetical protein
LIQSWWGREEKKNKTKKWSVFHMKPSLSQSSLRVHMCKIQCGWLLYVFILLFCQSIHVTSPRSCSSNPISSNYTSIKCQTF